MDNITHTLIGIAIGEAVATHRKKARIPLWIASGIANNLPDLDVLLTTFVFRDKLDYLLHHRGHTHTFLATPLLAAVVLLPLLLLWRRKPEIPWREIVFLLLLGTSTHLLADFWNSYGVHPFWPISNDWIYGDMVFIVEPWIWVMILPAIFFASSSWIGKGLSALLTAFILGLAWYHSYVPGPAALALTLASAALYGGMSRIAARGRRIALSLSMVGALLVSMAGINFMLKGKYAQAGVEFLLQPFPANPFCWSTMHAKLDEQSYSAEIAVLAPFPLLISASQCRNPIAGGTTAPIIVSTQPAAPGFRSIGRFTAPRAEYDLLVQDCRVNAFFRFARIPYWKKAENGWIVGDLRFDRDPGVSFSEFEFPDGNFDCPDWIPPWAGRFHPEKI